MMSNELIRSYKIKVPDNVGEFLDAYRLLLQRAIDEIWANIRWYEKVTKVKRPVPIPVSDRKRILPILPMDNGFKRNLRSMLLMSGWDYAAHYVDSAIRQAYMIMKSWRRRYVKGDASREKPMVRKRFVRIRKDLYTYRNGKIRITVRPYEYVEFDVSRAWFWSRIPKGAKMGELILGEGWLTITFRYEGEMLDVRDIMAWDLNLFSMDGFNPTLGWIKVDLGYLFRIHRFYEANRQLLQIRAAREPRMREVMGRFSSRERRRSRDFIEKLTTEIARRLPEYGHVFEDLDKSEMLNGSKDHNREISRADWMTIVRRLSDKSVVVGPVDPGYTSQQCPRCGLRNTLGRGTYTCRNCGLEMNRQLVGALNVYLRFKDMKPSPETFAELTGNIGDRPNITIEIMPTKRIDPIRRLGDRERIRMETGRGWSGGFSEDVEGFC